MPIQVPSIREFPDDDRIWRLDWLGAVEQHPNEAKIDVYLSPAKPGIDAPRVLADFEGAGTKIQVGAGQLPLLIIGTLWRRQRRLRQTMGQRINLRDVRITSDTVKLVDAGTRLAERRWLIPPFAHQLDKSAWLSQCLAIEHDGDPHRILLPVSEAIRFYYAVSSDLAHAVFGGAFRFHMDTLANPGLTGMLPGTKRMVVQLRQWLVNDDAWVIARVLEDRFAAAGVIRIYDSLLRITANTKPAFPECSLPFSGVTVWDTRGVSLPGEAGAKRWLIHELQGCSASFPFEELEVVRDNDSRKAEDPDKDLPPEEKKPAWAGGSKVEKPKPGRQLQSDDPPDVDLASVGIPLASERFGFLHGKEIIKTPKEQCKYKSASLRKPKSSDLLGTGNAVNTSTGVGQAKIGWQKLDVERRKRLPASFDTVLQIVDELNKVKGIAAVVRPPAAGIDYLRPAKRSRISQWGYLDQNAKTVRRVLVIDIRTPKTCACLIEFEQRATESYKLALLVSGNQTVLPNMRLMLFLGMLVSAQGVWLRIKSLPDGARLVLFKHTRPSAADFAKAIEKALGDAFP